MMKPTLMLVAALSLFSLSAHASGNLDASVMKFKVYKFAVSESTACTSPITVFSSTAGVQQNMLSGPTFGSGPLKTGTYPCVMIEMSKVITTASATTSGFCTASAEFPDVICNDSGQLSQLIDGTAVTCSGGTSNDQHVTLYITTVSAGTNGNNALLPPTSASDTTAGLKLTNPFVVSASKAGTLSINYHNFLDSGGGHCNTNAPTFSFE